MSKEEKLAALRAEVEARGGNTVFGYGLPDARIVMIGEAPGEQEVRQGRPFVGKAGKNLDEFLALAGLPRESLYITNCVKIRPSKISAAGNTVNRAPNRQEIALYLPYLEREIEIIKPSYIVTLGNVPLTSLMGKTVTIGDMHGTWLEYRGIPLYPMYHPASVIYNRALKPVYEADVCAFGKAVNADCTR